MQNAFVSLVKMEEKTSRRLRMKKWTNDDFQFDWDWRYKCYVYRCVWKRELDRFNITITANDVRFYSSWKFNKNKCRMRCIEVLSHAVKTNWNTLRLLKRLKSEFTCTETSQSYKMNIQWSNQICRQNFRASLFIRLNKYYTMSDNIFSGSMIANSMWNRLIVCVSVLLWANQYSW